ncbi:MAG: YbjQ family protein [Candidatus Marinimicrobia bacterium]|nr:YbjQ family protein [Candidatus Neomarinimicrobiota bacterium]MDD9888321.1 YbjQ family protein [Candidatus Neomarinimicrobiota bacterium]MDD9931338.1 YbjQ family protein [Candidatus Neomarinimicrobiota bacterium]
MIISTTEHIAGYVITEHLGTVIGNTIRARHVGKDIMAAFRTLVGGEVKEYTGMMAESREQALMRMKDRAEEMGADAVVGVRFQTSMILQGTAELLVYGTAVKIGRK